MYNYKKKKKIYIKCEIKTASRQDQVIVNKWVIAIEPNQLNSWLIHSGTKHSMLLRDVKKCLEWFLLVKQSKTSILCLYRKPL